MKTHVAQTRSEYGKGLAYSIGLFLAHADRLRSEKQTYKHSDQENAVARELDATYSLVELERWFAGASEHLHELQIAAAPTELRNRVRDFRDRCLAWSQGFISNRKSAPTKGDYEWAIREAKDILFELDRINGVNPIKATYE